MASVNGSRIFHLARSQYGQLGPSLVAKAKKEGMGNTKIMEELGECIDNVGELARALGGRG